MSNKKIVVLNGTGEEDNNLEYPFSVLTEVLADADVKYYHLKEIKLAHCTGCFGCWTKTPGVCEIPDEGREISQAIIQSDMTILFTPVTFGGYSSVLKIIMDRIIPLLLPFFGTYYGEIHHKPRYSNYPRLVGIGIQPKFIKKEAELFKALVGRNAINFHAPSFAADVFHDKEDRKTLKKSFRDLISRSDPFPVDTDIKSFFPEVDLTSLVDKQDVSRNALHIVGSPKVKKRSTSSILGEHLLDPMISSGWKTEVLTLKGNLKQEKGQIELCTAVDRSDLIILAFPLYIDALPYLVTKAFEIITRHQNILMDKKPKRIFTIVNNGFPEFNQNALALGICRLFADQSGMSWAGFLALGAGESIGNGQKLNATKRPGPPVKHIIEALDKAGTDLAMGRYVSLTAQSLISKTPIPLVSFGLWRKMYKIFGGQGWKRQALENGVQKAKMYAKPYAD